MKRFAIIAAAGLMLGLAACKSNEKTTDAGRSGRGSQG